MSTTHEQEYNTSSVEMIGDDVFGTGSVVASFAYDDGNGLKEVYIENVDECGERITYSLREFGKVESQEDSAAVDYRRADDESEIIDAILGDDNVETHIDTRVSSLSV